MTVEPVNGLVDHGTVVTNVTSTIVTVSKALLANVAGKSLTFIFPVSQGIVQHTEVIGNTGFFGLQALLGPASVATAVIPLFSPPPANGYLDITIQATRNSEVIPSDTKFYNVLVQNSALPTSPDQYQEIPNNETSLYIALPPPIGPNSISLDIPSDGSAPEFNALLQAMETALQNDPIAATPTIASLITSPASCTRVAYDVVWSYQNALPAPPDALESLYTNPPNPGGSVGSSSDSTNNLEQDRQKFEGTLNSFYSTRNATAERLTKFVAAVSAAVVCEQASLNSAAALMEFPVDPSSSTFATEVESELLLQGVEANGSGGINFGVPAAFFYALTSNLDKSTSAQRRFQQATGDDIERLLQQFEAAQNAGILQPDSPTPPSFVTAGVTPASITSFQAARRLVALRVSAASTSPSVTLFASTPSFAVTPLAKLVGDWLAATDPTPNPAPNPPLTYLNTDFNIWTRNLAPADQQGYLALDLDALTQGYVIPSFSAFPSSAAGATLTFPALNPDGTLLGVGVGMPVSGTNIAPGTIVTVVSTTGGNTTVTLNPAPTGAVTSTDSITFNAAVATVTATTTADCPALTATLTFAGPGATNGIQKGMTVFGPNIPANTTVSGVSAPTVTLSGNVSADVPPGTVIEFATYPPPSLLADQIALWLPSTTSPPTPNPTVETLRQVTATQWTSFFTTVGNPTWLPPFTQPVAPGISQSSTPQKAGYVALRIRAFIRAVQLFFTVSSVPTSAQLPAPGAPPTFDLPTFDPIGLAVKAIPGFKFGTAFTGTQLQTAVSTVFPPPNPEAQAWLTEAMNAINDLWQVASVVQNPVISGGYSLPNPVSFAFSVAEALYARGFRRASDISNISGADFQQALIGTVAYDFALTNTGGANSPYQQAQTVSPPTTTPGQTGGGPFQPINDGSLVDCVPPPCLSPLGPILYLQEMLKLSQASTCDNPWAPPASEGQTTLGDAVAARRGPVGSLLADCANLETPLPVIDMVNECLEYLGATQPSSTQAPSGTIYDTSADQVAGYKLCEEDDCCKEKDCGCHEPAAIYAALPEYSTPATPVKGENDSVEPLVYDHLQTDFSSCCLPYSQALDMSRTYLHHLGSCRFEELRTFRKCITEFALDPANPPAGFQSFLWRYPVRIDTAIEYLGITPDEYALLFLGTASGYCGSRDNRDPGTTTAAPASGVPVAQLYGYPANDQNRDWMEQVVVLSEFLKRTRLTYCEFLELSKVMLPQGSADNNNDGPVKEGFYPECEPCCLQNYRLQISQDSLQTELLELAVFIRLWRKLKEVCGARYTFQQLYDICSVLKLFNGTTINPDFIRQLAAFQMLRDYFKLPLVDQDDTSTGTTGADRTHLLALWVGSSAKKWNWAVHQLLEGVEKYAKSRFGCTRASNEELAHMADNLDALSRLAGFNPPTSTNPSTDTWNSTPCCTLRFAEVLAKIAASKFRVGELLYLFNAVPPHEHEDPFAQDAEDALNYPLDLPEEGNEHSLWRLREQLLAVEAGEEEVHHWTWPRIVAEFRSKFGYVPPSGQDPLLSIGQHFFPEVLENSGYAVTAQQRQYRTPLTSTTAWNTPPGGPFQYDSGSSQLWIQLPLRDEAAASQLSQLPALNSAEQVAVQDLYFAPRVDLALLTFLFPDWQSAERHLIQEHSEHERWAYFRRHFALADARRKVIVKHLAKDVARHSDCHFEELESSAGLVLSQLFSDENTGTPWESVSGDPPQVMWTPPSGGAIAALLGLIGTGLLGEYQGAQIQTRDTTTGSSTAGATYQDVWREVRGPMEAFGHERDHTNSPVPTILPALGLSPTPAPLVTFNNGYAVKNSDGEKLGGAEAIRVRWSGVLLVEHEGEYRFRAGAPAPDEEEPSVERARASQWRITLARGSKTWLVLNHQWPGETGSEKSAPRLRPGAYSIVIEYNQPAPDYTGPSLHPQRTGFQVKYAGPDTHECLVTLPVKHLYRDYQDQTLDQGISFLPGSKNAQAFLKAFYTSTLRDMRRTYQRAFKAVLFTGRFGLSARRGEEGDQSELGYMLENPDLFAGHAYYRSGTTFTQHLADFDFNFLPLQDNYHPPTPTPGDRSDPSLQRTQAMFDWWERIFDYDRMRKEVHRVHKGHLWQLFEEAQEDHPTDPAGLLRYIGAATRERSLELRFFQDQTTAIYNVSSTDLEDERWLIRVWHADRWLCGLQNRFHAKDVSKARPDLWASTDPSELVALSGVTQTGNANLLAFLADGCIDHGKPRHYLELKRMNDGLRERGRNALVAYLCHSNRVALPWAASTYATTGRDLSDLLLLDVETGICEKASRIDEAISAVQTFVRRSRIGLEPNWKVGRAFTKLWDSRFETFRKWQRCKRREFYKENFIEWAEFGKARRIEAFRFLESQLKDSTLTLAAPGGLDYWADDFKSLEHEPKLLQCAVPSELQALTVPPGSATREGLGTLGSPEFTPQPTWLAAVPQTSTSTGNQTGNSSSGSTTGANTPAAAQSAQSLVRAAAGGGTQPQALPFWMESAMNLGTQFLRIAAAGVPEAALGFVPHGEEPKNACCRECGCEHPVLVDEYYFWLVPTQFYTYTDDTDAQDNPGQPSFTGSYQFGFQDSYYDPYQQQSAEWDDEDQVPSLLAKWEPNPAVRLAWCRVHNGEFGQPRKSEGYVAIDESATTPADLIFLGRAGDSLYFQVSNSADLPPGYGGSDGDTSPPGFRYDLPSDEAVALPQALAPPKPPSPSPYPAPLLSYPFFAYDDPGARLFPAFWFAPSLLVGNTLRDNCHFELALKWYQRAFNPLEQDCAWMHCSEKDTTDGGANPTPSIGGAADQNSKQGACCDSARVSQDVVRHRAITLHWCQAAMDWVDAVMRRGRSPEAFEQARTLCDAVARVTGPRPRVVRMPEPATTQTVTGFVAAYPPLNPRLMDLYDLLVDRLELIHQCLDSRRLRNGRLNEDMCYFGDNPLRDGWRTVPETCAEEGEWCWRHSPYRFLAQIPKAIELAAKVREFGGALLAAYKEGDAERLASIHAEQEREMMALNITVRQDQWRNADWQVQALQQTKEVNQTNLLYYTNLYQNGLINDEIQNLSLSTNAMQTRTSANITEAIGEALKVIPDFFVGAMSTFSQVPIGTKLAGLFETIAKVMLTVAEIQSATAAIDMTEANWQRRSDEWFHQMRVLPIEIQKAELDILGMQRVRDQNMLELNNQQRSFEHSAEVLDFLRDKFTATDLFLYLQRETAELHRQMFKLAHHAAMEAQRAFNLERGHTTRRFIPDDIWDNLHQGLMAGERLESALRHMEKAYLDENVREYELTKHFSLRLHFPEEFLRLKVTGHCEIEIPEWMFDLDYPGHYMRRIKNLSVTIPCVTGPYTGVHCRVTLLSSKTRIDPRIEAPSTGCCCECKSDEGYEACEHDPRVVHMYGAQEAIATSSGQNDSGLFELNLHDERRLPFEYHGASCRLRFDLPFENNCFPMEPVTDVLVQMNLTTREGGDMLRRVASRSAQKHLPGSGWCYFDVRHEFPDAWQLLQNSCRGEKDARAKLALCLERKMFPYIPGAGEISITGMAILFHANTDDGRGCWTTEECPCPQEGEPARHVVGFKHGCREREDDELQISCLASEDAPGLYYGVFDTNVGPLGGDDQREELEFCFPARIGELERVYLLCRYERHRRTCEPPDARVGRIPAAGKHDFRPQHSASR